MADDTENVTNADLAKDIAALVGRYNVFTAQQMEFFTTDQLTVQIDNPSAEPVTVPSLKGVMAQTAVGQLQGTDGSQKVGTTAGMNGAVERTVSQKLYDFVSVKDFGAKGDGNTDDTAALQAAINSGVAHLWFPPGLYINTGLIARSGQSWLGAGPFLSVLSFPQTNIARPPGSYGIRSDDDLQDFHVEGIGVRGTLTVQTSTDPSGQALFGIHLRAGSVRRVSFSNCHVYEWGAQDKGTGGGAAVGATTGSGKAIEDVLFDSCIFENNSNVPGVYVGGISTYTSTMRNINVTNSTFINTLDYADQNAIYILGDTNLTAVDVRADGNTFVISNSIDVGIEINYTSGFSASDNMMTAKGSADLTGILIRGNCYDGTICNNTIRNLGTGSAQGAGIALVNFNDGEVQNNITISGNVISDFGDSAINISRWSSFINVVGNTLVSKRKRTGALVKVASTHNSVISNNVLSGGNNAILIGGGTNGTRKLDIVGNTISDCGASGNWVIDSPTVDSDIQYLRVLNNSIGDITAGTSGFINTPYAAITGNVVSRNYVPPGTVYINASYIAKLFRWDAPATNSGNAINGTVWGFAQGAIDFQGSGGPAYYTIGANLDGTNTGAVANDSLVVSCSKPLAGVVISPYVDANGKIRIVVYNVTGTAITIEAATWWVRVMKRVG